MFSLFHIVTVVLTLLVSHGGGEGQAFLVAILDFPLVLLLQLLPGGDSVLYGSSTAYVGFFSVAGTLLYAAAGYGVGLLLRALIASLRPSNH